TQHHPSSHLLVLDPAIQAPEQLIQGAVGETQVLRLTGEGHPLEQISQFLQGQRQIKSIHLIAHGEPGRLQLAGVWLDHQQLQQWGDRLQQWSVSLTAQASLFIYGCRSAAGELGSAFLRTWHELLGVPIIGATQVLGQGNWTFDRLMSVGLETLQTVSFSDSFPFAPGTLATYSGTFEIPNFLYATDNSNPAELFILNPDTGRFEEFDDGSDRVPLAAETFALSRGTDGKLFYTGTEVLPADQRPGDIDVSVYQYDPDNPNSPDNGLVGTFVSRGRPIVMLGQARDNRLYALDPASQELFVLDVTDVDTDDRIAQEIIDFGENFPGGGDLAFDPEDESGNILFFTSRQGSADYRLYRADISNPNNPTVTKVGNLVNADGGGPQDAASNSAAGSLAFAANGDLFFNAGAAVFSLSREDLADAIGGNPNQNLRSRFVRDFGAQVGGSNLSDFGSLPLLSAALTVEVDKVSEGDQVNPGDEITYRITVTNEGEREIPNVVVSDPLPEGVSDFRWTRDIDGDTESGTGAIDDDRFALAPGQEAVYEVVATVQSVSNLNLDEDAIVNEVTVRVPGFAIVDPDNPDRLLNSLTTSDSIQVGNQPPEVIDSLVTTPPGEQTPVTGLFGTDDGEIDRFVIRTIPTGGTLRLGDRTIRAGDEIDPADIGNLVFDAGNNFNGSSFTYTAIDNLGAESEPGTITLNSPPTATGGSETVPPGSATNLSDSLLSANDPDGNVDFFKITELPPTSQGRLFIGDPERGGREVRENDRLTPGQLDQLFFKAEPGFTGTSFE
ncbi:DUF4347 domain-containing protein, partial [Geitlerinema sp. P-1104]|uniref:DUF4347 domain-containing protein n=1 Tax=Geitlerinema sp. P-1104 TaxID=2546230 RepID=UPI0014769223